MNGISTSHEEADAAAARASRVFGEALIVSLATVAPLLVGAVWRGASSAQSRAFTDQHLYNLVLYELVVAAVAGPLLWRRGWRPLLVAGVASPFDLLRGIGLAVGAYVGSVVVQLIVWVGPFHSLAVATLPRFSGVPAGPLAIVAACVVDPIFEELLWLGYFVGRLRSRVGWRVAALLSVILRLAVHVYQGPFALLGLVPIAVVFTWYYVRTQRLWPVIAAHAFIDAFGLAVRLMRGY